MAPLPGFPGSDTYSRVGGTPPRVGVERGGPNDKPTNLAELREDLMRWRMIKGTALPANVDSEDMEWYRRHPFSDIFSATPHHPQTRALRLIDYLEEIMDVYGDDGNDSDLAAREVGMTEKRDPVRERIDEEDAHLLKRREREKQIEMLAAVIHRQDHPLCPHEIWSPDEYKLAKTIVDAGWTFNPPPMAIAPGQIVSLP